MNLWTIVDFILDWINWIRHWRFTLCLLLGTAAASAVYHHIPVDPWRWIVSGAIFLAAIVLGLQWNVNCED